MFEILADACANVVVPAPSEQAMRYYTSGNTLWIMQQLVSLAIPLLFLFTGFSGKLSRLSERWGRKWYPSLVIYLAAYLIISSFLSFPLDYYSDFVRQHAYGLSNQTLGRWFGNWNKSLIVSFIGCAAFVWIFYLLLRKSPKRWWIYGSFVSIAVSFFLVMIQPIWIAPLFNKFGPMKNKQLETQILDLAARAGIEGARVFEVDMSSDTKAVNAYVTGFGSTKRIVLWDTTIEKLSTDEILFVMGHEMGHYVLNHIWWGFLFTAVMTFIIFYLLYRLSQYVLNRYRKRFGFTHLYQFASFPLFLLLITVLQLAAAPLFNAFSRKIEHNADCFGLEITQNSQAAGEAFVALQQENLANPRPGPIFTFWRASHPSLGSRVDYCNSYCPWAHDETLKYGKYFKNLTE